MAAPPSQQTLWESLHEQERFQPLYPSEAAVRFVMTQFPRDRALRQSVRVLDLGCGAGRHTLLLAEQGFHVFSTDISLPGLRVSQKRLADRGLGSSLIAAAMQSLPFADHLLNGVVACGVVNYNDLVGLQRTLDEIHRVLVSGGKFLVVTRTTRDYRYGKGTSVDRRSFTLTIAETNEKGMTMCFLDKRDVRRVFRRFAELQIDRTETTTDNWRLDSDWIITAVK
jgi:ubiquinone/menaquinone biosynthesis C-methylase UbiE